jgi:hypothetical protein
VWWGGLDPEIRQLRITRAMKVSINEYAQDVKRAHVPVSKPCLLERGERCKVEYTWIQKCQG